MLWCWHIINNRFPLALLWDFPCINKTRKVNFGTFNFWHNKRQELIAYVWICHLQFLLVFYSGFWNVSNLPCLKKEIFMLHLNCIATKIKSPETPQSAATPTASTVRCLHHHSERTDQRHTCWVPLEEYQLYSEQGFTGFIPFRKVHVLLHVLLYYYHYSCTHVMY